MAAHRRHHFTHQIGRCRAPWECLHGPLRQPLRAWVPGHREPEQLSSTEGFTNDEEFSPFPRETWVIGGEIIAPCARRGGDSELPASHGFESGSA